MTIPAIAGPDASAPTVSYVLPLRRWRRVHPDPLTDYLRWLNTRVDIIVVDGSAPELYATHRATWGHLVRHVPVDPGLVTPNGKVGGVLTGLALARAEKVVIADDDVRYDDGALQDITAVLDRYDLVRPQNVFTPLSGAARYETARILLNRALGQDFPGTFGVRRSALLVMGGYDGDVVFENLELLRTAEAAEVRIAACPGLYVQRLPPDLDQLARQQVRYAYESLAQPVRLALELAVVPVLATLLRRQRYRALGGYAATVTALAEIGRRRAGGRTVFPVTSSLIAPCWLITRGVCCWAALSLRLTRGGLPYSGTTIRRAASSTRSLRARGSARL
jgi:hypothetical protein